METPFVRLPPIHVISIVKDSSQRRVQELLESFEQSGGDPASIRVHVFDGAPEEAPSGFSTLGKAAAYDLFDNHLRCCQLIAQDEDYEWGIVLEDDARFDPDLFAGQLRQLREFADSGAVWDMIYLGHHPVGPSFPTRTKGIRRTFGSFSSHAYVMHKRLASRLPEMRARYDSNYWFIDNWYRRQQMIRFLIRSYASSPSCVYQIPTGLFARIFAIGREDTKKSQRIFEAFSAGVLPALALIGGAVLLLAL